VQFHWDREGKYDSESSCWIRVASHSAGKQWGSIQIPRIGHEVAVGFLDDDADRPVVLCSLYNGRGEGGVPATPGGQPAEADDYFSTYYAPNNLTGVLVGDFDAASARSLLERYFGRIPRGEKDPPEVVTVEPTQLGEKRYNAEAETPPTVRVWWHAAPFVHRDRTPLDLLSDLLTGRTGRLYKGLVLGRQIANEVEASVDLKKYAGAFEIEGVVKEGKDPAAVEAAIHEEIARVQNEPIPPEEMQKIKNQGKASAYRRLSSPFSIAIQLLYYDGLGDWKYINSYAEEVDAVTAADIQRVARTYLTRENRTVGVFLRKAAPAQPTPGGTP